MIAWLVPLVIAGAEIRTADAPPQTASVLVDGGRIVRIGTFEPPPGAQVLEGRGLVLTPGFIDPATQLGLVEIDMVAATRDQEAEGDDVRAAFRTVDAFNPESTVIPIQRAHGVTTALALPTGGLIAGRGFAFDLDGTEPFLGEAVLVASLGPEERGSRGQRLARLRAVLDDARFYRANRSAQDRNQLRALAAHPLDLEALFPVLDGKLPVLLWAHRRADIRAAVAFAAEEKVRVVLAGATEAWREAERLAAAGIPVVIDPFANLPGSFDTLGAQADQAARLHAAGVKVAFSTFSAHRVRTLRFAAGEAVRRGLPPEVALAAVTARPAEAFGLPDRGRIAPGQVANLVLWSGDPFEPASAVAHLIINGRVVDTDHRQRRLLERYRTLPHTRP